MEDDFDPTNQPKAPQIIPGWVIGIVELGLWILLIWMLRGKLL